MWSTWMKRNRKAVQLPLAQQKGRPVVIQRVLSARITALTVLLKATNVIAHLAGAVAIYVGLLARNRKSTHLR